MTDKINWVTEWETALAQAKSDAKPVFLDFFNPQ